MEQKYTAQQSRRERNLISLFLILFLGMVMLCLMGTLFLYREHSRYVSVSVDLNALESPYAVLLDASSGKVIASRQGDAQMYPASMVKIMTVWIAAQELKNLDETVSMDYGIYDTLYLAGASRAGFEPGEIVTVRDLLYGALLPSGAECCMELAILVAGSEDAFVEKMNESAAKLGLTQTQFANCTGLHSQEQYSTVTEIGLILREALKNKTFAAVFTTKTYTSTATAQHPDGLTVESSMFKTMGDGTVTGGTVLGGKTGYTDAAGHCLASEAEISGHRYILVTGGWPASQVSDAYHISDAVNAYDQIGAALS